MSWISLAIARPDHPAPTISTRHARLSVLEIRANRTRLPPMASTTHAAKMNQASRERVSGAEMTGITR